MRTIRTKLYKFDELVVDAQQNAIEEYRENQYIDLDMFNESVKEQIEEAGFYEDVKLQYSLSYCQGDGLSFECNRIKESVLLSFFAEILGKNKEKTAKIIMKYCTFECTGNKGSHYCYASKGDISYEFDDYSGNKNLIHEIVSKVEDKVKELYLNLCKEFENQGYKELEYLRSDENIREILLENEYEFLKSGKRY